MSMLEFTLKPYKKREFVEESSLSTVNTESDKKSIEHSTSKSEEQEIAPPPNFDARMKNVFETIVELHLAVCYPPCKVKLNA